jgi:hypothetical protein
MGLHKRRARIDKQFISSGIDPRFSSLPDATLEELAAHGLE